MLSKQDIQRVAEALGLCHNNMADNAGPRVVISEHSHGFICTASMDPNFPCPSTIGITDGTVVFSDSWNLIYADVGFLSLDFFCIGCSFVAVDFYGYPERVFLFPKSPKFNLEKIIERLIHHRHTAGCKNRAANDVNPPARSE